VKVGGWGPVYGDEGSAYRIGQMSLRAAAREYDGRGPATALKEALLGALGMGEFRETVSRVYVEGMEPREIAALSKQTERNNGQTLRTDIPPQQTIDGVTTTDLYYEMAV